jgi:DNA-binding transcriptional LysR family regulator
MNLHQLSVFYEVAKSGSFSSAAQTLLLTQPAVTWQMKSLEGLYEVKLFERMGKKIALTEEGKVLFDFADRILNLTRQAEAALADLKGLSRGSLKVDSTFTFGDFYLPDILSAFHRKHPKISVQVTTGNSTQIIENTLLHKNDVAFAARDPHHEKLEAREFTSDRLVAILPPAHPLARRKSISLKEIEGQPLILRERGSSPRRILDEILEQRRISPRVITESASTSAIKKMVERGVGISILSQQVVKKELQARVLKQMPFSDVDIAYTFYFIYHKDKYLSHALKAFLDIAMEFSRKGWPE